MSLYGSFNKVILISLNEEQLRELRVGTPGTVWLPLRGKDIVTVTFEL